MKTKQQIIDETEAAYADPSNRGYNSKRYSCEYLSDRGKKCAIGRVVLDPSVIPQASLIKDIDNVWRIGSLLFTDDLLKEEYRGHEPAFWKDLQTWHDNHRHFNETSITDAGNEELERIRHKWVKV